MATGVEAASPDRILGGSRDRCWPRVPDAGLPNGVSGGLSSVAEVRDTVGGRSAVKTERERRFETLVSGVAGSSGCSTSDNGRSVNFPAG